MELSALRALHFLHPAWLLAAPPLLLLAAWLARRRRRDGGWSRLMDAELIPALQLQTPSRGRSPWSLFAGAWILAVLALAGPSWQRREDAAFRVPPAWVAVLDLSPSMSATDVAPDRMTRARYAIDDLLSGARDARIGLVAFAAEPYTVVPLTTDVATVHELLRPLSPALMPAAGDQMAPALEQAGQLLQAATAHRGQKQVIVVADGCSDPAQAMLAAEQLRREGVTVNVIGVGSTAGAPMPDGHGGFKRDAQGQVLMTRVEADQLQRIATAGGGRYVPLSGVSGLIDSLQADSEHAATAAGRDEQSLRVTTWLNGGIWLLAPLLLVAAALARRGWL